jgi:hypothetical protein
MALRLFVAWCILLFGDLLVFVGLETAVGGRGGPWFECAH